MKDLIDTIKNASLLPPLIPFTVHGFDEVFHDSMEYLMDVSQEFATFYGRKVTLHMIVSKPGKGVIRCVWHDHCGIKAMIDLFVFDDYQFSASMASSIVRPTTLIPSSMANDLFIPDTKFDC